MAPEVVHMYTCTCSHMNMHTIATVCKIPHAYACMFEYRVLLLPINAPKGLNPPHRKNNSIDNNLGLEVNVICQRGYSEME